MRTGCRQRLYITSPDCIANADEPMLFRTKPNAEPGLPEMHKEAEFRQELEKFEKRYGNYAGAHKMAVRIAAAEALGLGLAYLQHVERIARNITPKEAGIYFREGAALDRPYAIMGDAFITFLDLLGRSRRGYFDAVDVTLNAEALADRRVIDKDIANITKKYDSNGLLFHIIGKTNRIEKLTSPEFKDFLKSLRRKAESYLSAAKDALPENPGCIDVLTCPAVANSRVAGFVKDKAGFVIREYFRLIGVEGCIDSLTSQQFMEEAEMLGYFGIIDFMRDVARPEAGSAHRNIYEARRR